jgi:hypothetical protein
MDEEFGLFTVYQSCARAQRTLDEGHPLHFSKAIPQALKAVNT